MAEAPLIDTHFHIFTLDLPTVDNPRHMPEEDISAERLLAAFDTHGVTHGVVAAATAMGTYNDYTLAKLRQYPRLRGTVTLYPDADPYIMRMMKDDGVVGVRLPWVYRDVPDLDTADWRRFLRRMRDLDWHIHIHVGGQRMEPVLKVIDAAGVKLVVDHFGAPDPKLGLACPGFQRMLRSIDAGHTWVKMSGGFRLGWEQTRAYAETLLKAAGPERLVWGSDWPFLGHEGQVTYQQCLDAFAAWVPDEATRRRIGGETAYNLYFA
jgi:predicted TIM-barrel fold metal-dependent hydrolase